MIEWLWQQVQTNQFFLGLSGATVLGALLFVLRKIPSLGWRGVLSLFTRQSTVSNTRVDQKVEELVAHREMAGQTGTAIGLSKAITPPSVVS